MSQDKIESVRKIMKTNYGQTLLDQGVYRKDAAVKIALAEYGEETFNEIQKAIKSDYDKMMEQAISQATEAYVKDKTNAVPPAQQTKQEAKSAKEYFKNQSWFSFRP